MARIVCLPTSPYPPRTDTAAGSESTNRSGDQPDLDVASVADAYQRRVREGCPEQLPLALALLERLPPARWTLEWYLPWWLGRAFGLDDDLSREVVLSNVLGLASIRLQDDAADGDIAPDDLPAARTLAAVLYDAALEPYRARFDAASPFWVELERRMAAWRSGSTGLDLAARGAPLHIAAVAMCRYAERMDVYPALEPCLDNTLDALVRYDHVADWEADLDADRWNAFVAAASPGPQIPGGRDRHRAATYVTMLTSDVVLTWFDRIDEGLGRAVTIADSLEPPVPPLADHLRSFAVGVRVHGAAIHARYRDLGDEAAKRLFQMPADVRS
jgi:hypothetical protein